MPWKRISSTALSEIFGIDIRSLAAFRVGISVLLLIDLARRSWHLVAHYTDYGVLPRSAWNTFCATADNQGGKYWWSLHRLSGEPWWQVLLFCLAAFLAVLLLLGFHTRIATVTSWILLASLQARNPMVDSAGDQLLRCVLFWGMFLPLGAAASLDGLLQKDASKPPQRVLSAASVALLLQIVFVYLFTAALKSRGECWATEGSAVYFALSLDRFATPLGQSLLAWPSLLRRTTFVIYWFEWLGPLAAFCPVCRLPVRMTVIAAFWCFHVALVLVLHLGLFPWIMIVAWFVFIPSGCWDRLGSLALARRVASWGSTIAAKLADRIPRQLSARPFWRLGWAQSLVVAGLLAYVAAWNTWDVFNDYLPALPALDTLGHVTRLQQRWGMFARCPSREDGWFVVRGVLRDGSEVNLWQPGQPLPWTKPDDVMASYGDDRDQLLLSLLWDYRYAPMRKPLADWLKWRWDRQFAKYDRRRSVAEVELAFMLELTPPPSESAPPTSMVPLGSCVYRSTE